MNGQLPYVHESMIVRNIFVERKHLRQRFPHEINHWNRVLGDKFGIYNVAEVHFLQKLTQKLVTITNVSSQFSRIKLTFNTVRKYAVRSHAAYLKIHRNAITRTVSSLLELHNEISLFKTCFEIVGRQAANGII